jgi:hypothetical protein
MGMEGLPTSSQENADADEKDNQKKESDPQKEAQKERLYSAYEKLRFHTGPIIDTINSLRHIPEMRSEGTDLHTALSVYGKKIEELGELDQSWYDRYNKKHNGYK